MTTNQAAPVTDEELDQMIWKLERDGMTPKQLSLMRELREVRRAKGEPVAWAEKCEITNMKATGLYLRGFPDNSQGREIPLYTVPPAPVVPAGWVMVPVEPTKEMIEAGWLHFMGTKNPSSKGTYKAMLEAAPKEVG